MGVTITLSTENSYKNIYISKSNHNEFTHDRAAQLFLHDYTPASLSSENGIPAMLNYFI